VVCGARSTCLTAGTGTSDERLQLIYSDGLVLDVRAHNTCTIHIAHAHQRYAEPSHGVVLFRHHDPLTFSPDQLSDLLDAAWCWFDKSQQHYDEQQQQQQGSQTEQQQQQQQQQQLLAPFLLLNCLARAGASQYHGHAQVAMTRVPLPQQLHLQQAAAQYAPSSSSSSGLVGGVQGSNSFGNSSASASARRLSSSVPGGSSDDGPAALGQVYGQQAQLCYYSDLLRAHRAVGLLRQVSVVPPTASSSRAQLSKEGQSEASSSSLSSSNGGRGEEAGSWEGSAWSFASLGERWVVTAFRLWSVG